MKTQLLALTTAASLALIGSAVADSQESVTLTTGGTGGTYYGVYGLNMAELLQELGHDTQVLESGGSIDNLNRLDAGEANVGFTQADAYALWLKSHPSASLQSMGKLGQECLYVAVRKGGKIADEDDIGQEGVKIAVGANGSGSAKSWEYLQTLEPNYKKATVHYMGDMQALSAVNSGDIDAYLWVTDPNNLEHANLRAVLANKKNMEIIDLNDRRMNNDLPNGGQVYEFQDVLIEDGFFDTEVEVPCTSVLVMGSKAVGNDLVQTLSGQLLMNANRIRTPRH